MGWGKPADRTVTARALSQQLDTPGRHPAQALAELGRLLLGIHVGLETTYRKHPTHGGVRIPTRRTCVHHHEVDITERGGSAPRRYRVGM